MKPWAAVVRVSHMGERKAGSESFHADREQLDPIEAWAAAKGVRLAVMDPELGVSGGLPIEERPSLLRAIKGVEAGEYAGIVVAYLSRLGRNVGEQLKTWDRVEGAGGKVVTIREGIDTSSASGRLHRNLLLSIDAHEREQHAERFEERRRLATAAGIWQRRQTPTGYVRAETRKLVPDRPERVRRAFADLLAGKTVLAIAADLGMTPGGIRHMLRNRVYLGELRVGKHVNPAAHPPLVDVRTFEAAQQKLAGNVRPARGNRGPALLAGLCRCASCGHLMTRISSRGVPAYGCPRHHSGKPCPQPAAIMANRIDPYVERIALRELALLEVSAAEGNEVAEAEREWEEAKRELDAYLEAVSPQDVGPVAFAKAARGRQDAVEEAGERMRRQFATPVALDLDWEDLDAHERNTLLRHLLEAVVVRPSGRGKTVPVADRVRIVKFGAGLDLPGGGAPEVGLGIVPLPFDDLEGVLREPASEDGA